MTPTAPATGGRPYFTSTTAPCSSSLALIVRGLVLRHAGLHGLRRAVDQVLRFLQAQAGDLAHDLDDLDLLRAGFLERDRELGLLFGRRSRAPRRRQPAAAPPTGAAAIVTLNLLLNASISSASSKTDMLPIASRISSLLRSR